jgi:hypothetical protein
MSESLSLLGWFLENLSNPLFSSFLSGIITFFLMYIESKINNKPIHRRTYTKNILLVMTLVGSIVYLVTNYNVKETIPKIIDKTVGGGEKVLDKINYNTSDIFLGEPNF